MFEVRSGSNSKGKITVALKWVQVLSHVVVPQSGDRTAPHGGTAAGATDLQLDATELQNAAELELCLSSLNIKVVYHLTTPNGCGKCGGYI